MTSRVLVHQKRIPTQWRAIAWLSAFAIAAVALALWSPDSYQQDGGFHYLFARDAWWNHALFVDVWGRPLFTTLYALPARGGYLAAKLLTVVVCVATAWQSWKWAEDEGLARPEFTIPFLALQPSLMLLAADTMTEPLFALVLVVALRLRRRGRPRDAMAVASLLPLARPEGFFVCVLWGVWALADARLGESTWRRARALPLLASGVLAWWLAALAITRDPLFILHNWPPNWAPTGATYGIAPWSEYWRLRYEIVAKYFAPFFAIGFLAFVARRRLGVATSLVLMLFALHSVLRHYGLFGSAGYPRYFVCIAPAIALITLEGWNVVLDALHLGAVRVAPRVRAPLEAIAYVLAIALFLLVSRNTLYYIDDHDTARDARAVGDADAWLNAHPVDVHQLVWSQAYMCIIRDCDTRHRVWLSNDRAHNMTELSATPPGTLVFWDGETGPDWYGLRAPDFETAGFHQLLDRRYQLAPRFGKRRWYPDPWTRPQEMMLFYKSEGGVAVSAPRGASRAQRCTGIRGSDVIGSESGSMVFRCASNR